jgi:PIN domain nuclease of toxin-antitoxin system
MRIILDTHLFLWALCDPGRIGDARRAEIETLSNTVYVSAISIAEMMIKASLGKLDIGFDPVAAAGDSGFEILAFEGQEAVQLRDLPFHHRDPFDRMIIAQSLTKNYPIMTDDAKFRLYGCRLI